MIDPNKYIFRRATIKDVDFITNTIVEAEKSSSDKCGMANYFNISEDELMKYLKLMLEEEVDGCEFSISSFFVVEYEGTVVGALGGWIEGDNEDNLPSVIIKSNLLSYCLPKDIILGSKNNVDKIKELTIERTPGTYQLEFSFVEPGHQGQGLLETLMEMHFDIARSKHVKIAQDHMYPDNKIITLFHKCMGFKEIKRYISTHPGTLEIYPYNSLVLMEKQL